jgi:hypothetical protein
MTIYSISDASKHLAALLDRAKDEGKVLIRREDGTLFALCLE